MSSEVAIAARGLSKAYQLYPTPQHRLRQALRPRLARLLRPFGLHLPERRYFTEHWALRDLSFEVRRGETLAVIGRNGAGKSTLLQILCGTLSPTTGDVQVSGRVAALLELGSGFNPEYTGRENVLMNASVLGLSREEAEARMGDILALADIGEFVEQPVKTYSSGMAMRLAFSVIAHVDADVLVVDEALSVGDAYFQQKCMRWLRDFQQRGTLLFCGHDMGAVMGLCERAIWLDKGRVRMEGPAKDVAEAYGMFTHAQAMGLPEEAVRAPAPSSPVPTPDAGATPDAEEATDLPVLRLDGAAYGSGLAEVVEVRLADPSGRPLPIVAGGEEVSLTVRATARAALHEVIMGFHLKDRLGQVIFLGNSFRHYAHRPVEAQPGQALRAVFRFRMPKLVPGDYVFGAAIASGTQERHVQHHFVHEALAVRIHTPDHLGGLVSVPLDGVSLATEPA